MSPTRTREEVEALHRAYDRGELSLPEVAERFGVTTTERVRQIFRQFGFPLRTQNIEERRAARQRQLEAERERIIDLYKAYGTIDAVVAQVGLPRSSIAPVVATIPNREAYRRRGTYTPYSPQERARDLRRAAEAMGEPLTMPAYRDAAAQLGLISIDTQLKYGSWHEVCAAAGVRTNKPRGPRANTTSLEDCVAGVARCYRQLGHRPSYEQYREWARNHRAPSGPTIRNVLKRAYPNEGSWNKVVELALEQNLP